MGPSTRRRVAIVDGNEDAAQSLALLLALDGNDVLVLRSTHQALRLIVQARPDVVVTELALPGPHGGLAFCRLLRRHPALAECTIVCLAARSAPADRVRMKEAGAHYFFVKPADPDELAALIARASDTAWAEAEARQAA